MLANESHNWTSIELHKTYNEFGGSISRQNLLRKVVKKPFYCLLHASSIMRIEKDDNNITEITNIAKMINKDIKEISFDKTRYNIKIDLETVKIECSPTLSALLLEMSPMFQNSYLLS